MPNGVELERFQTVRQSEAAPESGEPRPPVLGGFIPDVYAVFDDYEVALSMENERSAVDASTRRQHDALTAWAREADRRVYEQIVVAEGRGGCDRKMPSTAASARGASGP